MTLVENFGKFDQTTSASRGLERVYVNSGDEVCEEDRRGVESFCF